MKILRWIGLPVFTLALLHLACSESKQAKQDQPSNGSERVAGTPRRRWRWCTTRRSSKSSAPGAAICPS